jgi:hypothetical protein
VAGLGPAIHVFGADIMAGSRRGCPGRAHGCPVERNRLFVLTREQLQVPLTGLAPVIHAFLAIHTVFVEDVGGRTKSGHGELWLCR